MKIITQIIHFLITLLGLIISSGEAHPTYLYHFCPNTTTFAPNSPYQSSLKTLLSSLSSNASNSLESHAVASSGGAVHAQFLCRGDVNSTACRDCVEFAVNDAVKRCPVEQEVMIWYDECQLRYSNRSFLGAVTELPRVALLNTANVTDQDRFNRVLNRTMSEAVSGAATSGGPGEKKYGTAEADFNGFQTLYSLAQCTPDLSGEDCRRCLDDAVGRLPICCLDRIGGRVLFPSCNVRYEFYPFYFARPADTLPRASRKSKISTGTVVAIVVPVAVLIMALLVLGLCYLRKRARKSNGKDDPTEFKKGKNITATDSLQFNLATIEAATNKFSADNKLGGGGFGEVYKGTLPNGKQIAIKRLSSKIARQYVNEFKNEVQLLAKLQHRNLVGLLGFCFEGEEMLLVYDFIPNKSLDHFLYDPDKQQRLDWTTRYNIIRGIARGILYLHQDSQPIIIHRDLKASNVLMDGDMNPRISDFGLARIFEADQTRGNTDRIVGTYGYMAPEYAMQGQYSIKTDVYSFGVLVLEIISGKKNTFYASGHAEDLLSYAWKLWKEESPLKMLDSTLRDSYSEKEVIQCIRIGLLCVQEEPEDRPTIKTIDLAFNSDTVTLPEPEKPAFYTRTEEDLAAMGVKIDPPTSTTYPLSVNEGSATNLCPR